MLASQVFKKVQLQAAREESQLFGAVLAALTAVDPNAQPLSLEQALVSRTVSQTLWDALPEEHLAYQFSSLEELKNIGSRFLGAVLETPITLHLGWDVLAFATTLRAAWKTLDAYCEINTDTYNTCIYPASLKWYLIRAGKNFYPMDCVSGETVSLIRLGETIPF